jgi:transcriptional regulator with XRE-family HTH domain
MPRVPKAALPPLENSDETIGQRIARYRKLRGMTQRQLADRIGIVQNLVSDYENGKLRLYDEMVARFATALKITSDDILGLKAETEETAGVSLRFLKRLAIIEGFPEAQKKRILRNLDDAIESQARKEGIDPLTTPGDEATE